MGPIPILVKQYPIIAKTYVFIGIPTQIIPINSIINPILINFLSPSLSEIKPDMTLPNINPPKIVVLKADTASLDKPSFVPSKNDDVHKKQVDSPEQ